MRCTLYDHLVTHNRLLISVYTDRSKKRILVRFEGFIEGIISIRMMMICYISKLVSKWRKKRKRLSEQQLRVSSPCVHHRHIMKRGRSLLVSCNAKEMLKKKHYEQNLVVGCCYFKREIEFSSLLCQNKEKIPSSINNQWVFSQGTWDFEL